MTGREFDDVKFKPSFQSDKNVLEVKDLSVPGAFENVSFSLKRGEILGVTGLLDSGRTELALSLFGLRKTSGGQILKDGKPITIASPRDAIANGIAMCRRTVSAKGYSFRSRFLTTLSLQKLTI